MKMISGRVFCRIFGLQGPSITTARKPPVFRTNPHPPPRAQSQIMCVGTFDLASVSPSLRSVSNNLRRDTPIVSPNLRRNTPLIARRTGYDCAPLHLAAWQDVATGGGYGQAAAALTARGVRTPRGGGQWTRAAVRSVIQRHMALQAAREVTS